MGQSNYRPQSSNEPLLLENCDVVVPQAGQERSAADAGWAAASQSYFRVIALRNLMWRQEIGVQCLRNSHLFEHL